jgi:Xaa-Pro aminopeptidase
MHRSNVLALTAVVAWTAAAGAQQGFTDAFPPEEFAARRAKVIAAIGEGVAILQGTTERRGESPLRQSNQFFYLTGVVEPRAMLLIDGRTRRSTLFLTPRTAARQRAIGPYLDVGDSSARATGLDSIVPRDSFTVAVSRLAADKRVIFTPFRPEVLGSESAGDVATHVRATKNDPWDGRLTREEAFIANLKKAAPESELRDLDPIIDPLRAVKSAREIAVIREATRLAGLGIMEAMRDAEPGCTNTSSRRRRSTCTNAAARTANRISR